MSAEKLRLAADLMRERAESARGSLPDTVPEWHSIRALMGEGKTSGDARHIASWHPAVALAVADWLEDEAAFSDESPFYNDLPPDEQAVCLAPALAVAVAYLGEQS